jgi:hypothetical protein
MRQRLQAIAHWNATYPVGTLVDVAIDGKVYRVRTRSRADLAGDVPSVFVGDIAKWRCALDYVKAVGA